ncbi:MAG TPA: hypothetical protein VHF89_06665 [Solirubrobacteraceae bacterium]|nr:hypothetical protein [Solirubrobacteraceae bacterium]
MADQRSPAERLLDKDRLPEDHGRGLSRHARQYQRTLEGYLQAGHRPRWMERLGEIDHGVARERRRLARAYETLRAQCAGDRAAFAARWRELAHRWPFEDVNELIGQHNEWFPIERQLPMDPRTRDYVLIHGRSYRREPLDAAWVLREFPAEA